MIVLITIMECLDGWCLEEGADKQMITVIGEGAIDS